MYFFSNSCFGYPHYVKTIVNSKNVNSKNVEDHQNFYSDNMYLNGTGTEIYFC